MRWHRHQSRRLGGRGTENQWPRQSWLNGAPTAIQLRSRSRPFCFEEKGVWRLCNRPPTKTPRGRTASPKHRQLGGLLLNSIRSMFGDHAGWANMSARSGVPTGALPPAIWRRRIRTRMRTRIKTRTRIRMMTAAILAGAIVTMREIPTRSSKHWCTQDQAAWSESA
jgi:hypothetical protein